MTLFFVLFFAAAALASTATAGVKSAPTLLYPPCFTAFIVNDYEWSSSNAPTSTPTDDRENFMFSFDAGKMLSSWLDSTSFGNSNVRVLTTQIIDSVNLRETFVYDFLNGTTRCFSMPTTANAVDTSLPKLSFQGTRSCAATGGSTLCDEWRCQGNCFMKSRPSQSPKQITLLVNPVTGLPVRLELNHAPEWTQTLVYTQASACVPNSLDPSLFAVPAGLACTNY